MSYKLKGTIKLIEDEQEFDSGFVKREFVVTTDDDKYPQDIKFELIKDKTSILDHYRVGQAVEVDFNLKGNEWNDKYFVNLQVWKIIAQGGSGTQQPPPQAAPAAQPAQSPVSSTEDLDDLPF